MGIISNLASLVSPKRALKRAAMKRALSVLEQPRAYYEGAGHNHRMAWRRFSHASATREVSTALVRLVSVSRDMRRNNPYASRGIAAITSNVVGEGIIPAVVTEAGRTKKQVQKFIKEHLDRKAIDFDGRNNLYGLQALAMSTVAESGECLILRRRTPSNVRLKLPFQVQVLEPDFLDISADRTLPSGGAIISGVEFDAGGKRVAYHLFKSHPGSELGATDTVRVPAEDVIHLFRVDRPGQVRGVPWLAPAMLTLWDLGQYEKAELVRQEIAACFAAFVTEADGKLAMEAGANATPAPDASLAPRETLEAGTIHYLSSGSTVSFGTPPQVQSYEAFIRAQLRKIAVAIGIPYEVLAGDLGQVNFSSGRMGWLEFQRLIDQWRWHLLIPHMCEGIGEWFIEALFLVNPSLTGFSLGWTPPRREMIQPKEEVEADVQEIRAGLASRQEKIRKRGYDPEEIDREQAEDNKRADAAGNSYDSDGRRPRQGLSGPNQQQEKPVSPANGASACLCS